MRRSRPFPKSNVLAGRTVLVAVPAFVAGMLATWWLSLPKPSRYPKAGTPPAHLRRNRPTRAARIENGYDPDAKAELPPARHELSDVNGRLALVVFPGMLAVLVLCIFLARWIYPHAVIDRRLPEPPPTVPAPRLQSDPATDMQNFLKAELARLNSRGWDDKAKGEGHIPIEDAMHRIAASGIPDWPK